MSVGEISTIIPGHEAERSKRELKFTYSTAEFDSYQKEGFEAPDLDHRPDKFEYHFLAQVDPGKGKIKVRIPRMFRIRAIDYSSEKNESREYLYYETLWTGKQWNGNELGPIEHVVGRHKEQTKRLELGQFDPNTGIQRSQYVMGLPRTVYTIPFTKKAVDEALDNEHPFGPDSQNVTDKESIKYYGFIKGLGIESFRCGDYNYEMFVTPEWKRFVEIATQEGGPQHRVRYPDEELKRMGLYK